jgi:hypothetical protein
MNSAFSNVRCVRLFGMCGAFFSNDLAPGYEDHDDALTHILSNTPRVLPSFARLSDEFKNLIMMSLRTKFNFGQFLQAENLPVQLVGVQNFLGLKLGPKGLAFYLFHILVDMAGVGGARTLEGSAFMTETNYQNFRLGLECLLMLADPRVSATEVYNTFLTRRAEAQGLGSLPFSRALCRLACLTRSFTEADGFVVAEGWKGLEEDVKARLKEYLEMDGISDVKTPAFLLYYGPAFLCNARDNPHVGIASALRSGHETWNWIHCLEKFFWPNGRIFQWPDF